MEFGLKEFGIVFVVLYFIYFLVRFIVYWKKESECERYGKSKSYRSKKW